MNPFFQTLFHGEFISFDCAQPISQIVDIVEHRFASRALTIGKKSHFTLTSLSEDAYDFKFWLYRRQTALVFQGQFRAKSKTQTKVECTARLTLGTWVWFGLLTILFAFIWWFPLLSVPLIIFNFALLYSQYRECRNARSILVEILECDLAKLNNGASASNP